MRIDVYAAQSHIKACNTPDNALKVKKEGSFFIHTDKKTDKM